MVNYFDKYVKYKRKYLALKGGAAQSSSVESEPDNIDLISFYFSNFGILLDLDIPEDAGISSIENTLHIGIISGRYNITEILPLLRARKSVAKLLAQLIEKDSDLIKLISKNILHPVGGIAEGDIGNYLEHLQKTDESLYQRVLQILESSDECCVCMDAAENTVFQCGHSTCSTCRQRIHQCPYVLMAGRRLLRT